MLARERWEEMKWEGRGFNPCECVSWCACTTTEQVSRIPGTGNQEEFQFSQEFRLSLSISSLEDGFERERERARKKWGELIGPWRRLGYSCLQVVTRPSDPKLTPNRGRNGTLKTTGSGRDQKLLSCAPFFPIRRKYPSTCKTLAHSLSLTLFDFILFYDAPDKWSRGLLFAESYFAFGFLFGCSVTLFSAGTVFRCCFFSSFSFCYFVS